MHRFETQINWNLGMLVVCIYNSSIIFLNGSFVRIELLDGQDEIAFAGLHPLLDSFVEFVCHEGQRVPFVQAGVVTLVQQGQCERRPCQRRSARQQLLGVSDLRHSLGVHHLKEHAVVNVHQVIHDVVVS